MLCFKSSMDFILSIFLSLSYIQPVLTYISWFPTALKMQTYLTLQKITNQQRFFHLTCNLPTPCTALLHVLIHLFNETFVNSSIVQYTWTVAVNKTKPLPLWNFILVRRPNSRKKEQGSIWRSVLWAEIWMTKKK